MARGTSGCSCSSPVRSLPFIHPVLHAASVHSDSMYGISLLFTQFHGLTRAFNGNVSPPLAKQVRRIFCSSSTRLPLELLLRLSQYVIRACMCSDNDLLDSHGHPLPRGVWRHHRFLGGQPVAEVARDLMGATSSYARRHLRSVRVHASCFEACMPCTVVFVEIIASAS